MTGQVAITYPVDALVSYHYYRKDEHMAALAATGRLRMIGDSGAFSAMSLGSPISLDEYAAWCHRWADHLYWRASLDVIGDPHGTLRNWRILRDKHQLATVPTVHIGTDLSWFDVYAREGVDYVGLGGLVGKPQPTVLRWVVHALRYCRERHPQMRFHAWGQAGRKFLDSVPVYSADSSGALGQAYRYGRLRIFDPGTARDHAVALDGGRDVIALGPVLRRYYGVDPHEIRTSHAGNRGTLIRLAAASVQQYAAWLQKRHRHVTAPTWGINPNAPTPAAGAPEGPRVHMVAGAGNVKQDLELAGGPRVHVVGGADHDLPRLVDGPRVHLVDGSITNLAATVTHTAEPEGRPV